MDSLVSYVDRVDRWTLIISTGWSIVWTAWDLIWTGGPLFGHMALYLEDGPLHEQCRPLQGHGGSLCGEGGPLYQGWAFM